MEQKAITDLEDKIKALEERIKHLEQWERSQNYLTRKRWQAAADEFATIKEKPPGDVVEFFEQLDAHHHRQPSPPHNEKEPEDDPLAPDVSLHW